MVDGRRLSGRPTEDGMICSVPSAEGFQRISLNLSRVRPLGSDVQLNEGGEGEGVTQRRNGTFSALWVACLSHIVKRTDRANFISGAWQHKWPKMLPPASEAQFHIVKSFMQPRPCRSRDRRSKALTEPEQGLFDDRPVSQ